MPGTFIIARSCGVTPILLRDTKGWVTCVDACTKEIANIWNYFMYQIFHYLYIYGNDDNLPEWGRSTNLFWISSKSPNASRILCPKEIISVLKWIPNHVLSLFLNFTRECAHDANWSWLLCLLTLSLYARWRSVSMLADAQSLCLLTLSLYACWRSVSPR